MDPQTPFTMSSQPFDTFETTAQVPVWAVFVTLGILAVTWAVATLAIEATASAREPQIATPLVSLLRN